MADDIERILVIESYAEALVIEARLEQEEIPHLLQAFNDPAFGSFWRREEGWGLLMAPREYRERIEEICAELRSSGPPSDSGGSC